MMCSQMGYLTVIVMLLIFEKGFASESLQSDGRHLQTVYLQRVIPKNRFRSSLLETIETENTISCSLACLRQHGCITSILNLSQKNCHLLKKFFGPLHEFNPSKEEDRYTKMTVAFASDPCKPNPCHKAGNCTVTKSGYQCICPHNRTGEYCNWKITGRSCLDIKQKFRTIALKSGAYKIVSQNGDISFMAYCDMKFGSGGWTRVLNIVADTTNKTRLKSKLKFYYYLKNVDSLGKFALTNSALQQFRKMSNFTQVRFKCKSTAENRTIHIKTNATAVIDYLTTGNSSERPDACGTFTRLKDDNSFLAQNCKTWKDGRWGFINGPDKALADHTFYKSHAHHWNSKRRFECDTKSGSDISIGDFWEVYIK